MRGTAALSPFCKIALYEIFLKAGTIGNWEYLIGPHDREYTYRTARKELGATGSDNLALYKAKASYHA